MPPDIRRLPKSAPRGARRWRTPVGALATMFKPFGVLGLAVLGGPLACVQTTEILPAPDLTASNLLDANPPVDARSIDAAADLSLPRRSYKFCPTTIDVFGGGNVALPGCGGIGLLPAPIESGYFAVGSADYDATLAGRIESRLAADPDLTARFGTTWKVRDCADMHAWLESYVPPIAADQCGPDAPAAMGSLGAACTSAPAPLILLVADQTDDRCHGGGGDSLSPNNQSAFSDHFGARLDAFLMARRPQFTIVGPKTEWQAQPPRMPVMMPPPPFDLAQCTFPRATWSRSALARWQTQHAALPGIRAVGDLQDQFIQHHRCCTTLGMTCQAPWFNMNPMGEVQVNCDGAQAIVDFWYARLKESLLGNDFQCP